MYQTAEKLGMTVLYVTNNYRQWTENLTFFVQTQFALHIHLKG